MPSSLVFAILQAQNFIAVEFNGQSTFITTNAQYNLNIQIRVAAQDH
ncbi:MAG: hypothetical protein K9J37_14950 [Saprospiraceae bacterium]|nr:hypothetical protein [Saprospiraceae bacterium]MCF8251207.1 hypothetical protein [Saprospiraceae bacterium]MCF8281191.1 hypothetical protein [Bacteroidales bacterium]MCF8313169.1 hypothetical protein [Saprospiraceae bacterium]MCF8441569.1 hypothetical protein [Saprospiraceae bacterium]